MPTILGELGQHTGLRQWLGQLAAFLAALGLPQPIGLSIERTEHSVAQFSIELGVDDVHARGLVDPVASGRAAALRDKLGLAIVTGDLPGHVTHVSSEPFGARLARTGRQDIVHREQFTAFVLGQATSGIGQRIGVGTGDGPGGEVIGHAGSIGKGPRTPTEALCISTGHAPRARQHLVRRGTAASLVQFVGPAGHGGDADIDEALHLAQQLADSVELARIGLGNDHPPNGPNGSNHRVITRA